MGGFGTAFAGALEGVGDALHREHQEQFATEVENRKSLMKMYGEMAMNPNVPPHVQREALRRWGTITQVPYNKKLPSDLTKPIDPAALLAQQPQQQGAPQGPSQSQGQPQAAAAPAGPSASIVPDAAASPGPVSPISSGGGASPGVLQGQANQLPPAQVQAAAPPPAPPSGGGITYTPQEIASQDASRASQITSAQTEAQLVSKYQAYIKMGMDPQRAAFLASGMASVAKPSGINVITDDGKHQAATKVFDPTDFRFHYYVGDQDITDHVVGTATSNAQVQAWPRITEKGIGGAPAAIQMAPNGPVFRRDDPQNPPEVQQQFATLGAPMTTTRSGGTTTDEFGNTRTSSTSTRSVGGATPPPAPSKSGKSAARPSAAGSGGAPAFSGEGKLGYDTNKMLRADAIKASNTIRPMVTLLDSAEQYYKSARFDSAGDLGLIINAVRSMNPGTVRLPNKEIDLELRRGTYGDQFNRWYKSRLVDGTLPQQFRDELMGVIRRETTNAAGEAATNWQQVMPNNPLPAHLKRFGGAASSSGAGRPPLSSFEKK